MISIRARRGFSLVELLVVMGIIAVLMGLLVPALSGARRQSKQVQCLSNLKQVGNYLVIYSNDNNGWIYPPERGADKPREQRWPVFVFKPPVWNPPILTCPEDVEPVEEHSYILNDHLWVGRVKYSSKWLGKPNTEVVVMGEKRSSYDDYYMNVGDFATRVEPYRHGLRKGSNYLYLDMHAGLAPAREAIVGLDPWDIQRGTVPATLPTH